MPPFDYSLAPQLEVAPEILSHADPDLQQLGSFGFIALSKFTVEAGVDANGDSHISRVKQAFRDRPHLVEDAHGFRKLEVFTPRENPNEIWLLTFWDDEPSYVTWHKSHLYHESHKGIPKGIRLVPRSTKIEYFDHIAS
jgi:heme oxygenase (mycobilin-producing)